MTAHKIQTDETTLPSYWASALVNGDYSGLSDNEAARCRETEEKLARQGWRIVGIVDNQEPRFTCRYNLYDPGAGCSGGEVLDYTLISTSRV